MNRLLQKALLLIFFLTSIGQFAYACADDHGDSNKTENICCCGDLMVKAGNGCDMDMSAPMADTAPCCDIDFQASNSDGSAADSVYAPQSKPPDFGSDPGVDCPALFSSHHNLVQAPSVRLFQQPYSGLSALHQSGRSLYLETLRLRL